MDARVRLIKSKWYIKIIVLAVLIFAALGINNVSKAAYTVQLWDQPNVYCLLHGADFDKFDATFTMKRSYSITNGRVIDNGGDGLGIRGNNAVNAIARNPNMVSYILYVGHGSGTMNQDSPEQLALWQVLTGDGQANDIYKAASVYNAYVNSGYINKGIGGALSVNTSKATYNNGVYGPFIINNYQIDNGGYIYGQVTKITATGCSVSNVSYTTSGTQFYLTPNAGTSNTSITAEINNQYINATFDVYDNNYPSSYGGNRQPLLAVGSASGTFGYVTGTYTFVSPFSVLVHKVDRKDQSVNLPGAVLNIKATQGSATLYNQNVTVDGLGNFTTPKVQPPTTGDITLTITEPKAPTGYTPLSSPIVITMHYSNGAWVPKTTSGTLTGGEKWLISGTANNRIDIRIEDNNIKFGLSLNKVDQKDQKTGLQGAAFTIQAVQDNAPLTLSSANVTTDVNGNLSITGTGKSTNDITVTITETKAPVGHALLSAPLVVTLQYKDGTWTLKDTSGTLAGGELWSATGDSKNNIAVKLSDNTQITTFVIHKTDGTSRGIENIKFTTVVLQNVVSVVYNGKTYTGAVPQGSSQRVVTLTDVVTDKNGNIIFQNIVPFNDGTVSIGLKEAVPPASYAGLSGVVVFSLSHAANQDPTKPYVWTTTLITEANKLAAPIVIEGKSYTYTTADPADVAVNTAGDENCAPTANVTNHPKIPELDLLKVNAQNSKLLVDGAVFDLKFTNVKFVNGAAAKADGTLDVPGLKVVQGKFALKDIVVLDANKPFTIAITETSAPTGYKRITGTVTYTLTWTGTGFTYSAVKTDDVSADEFTPLSNQTVAGGATLAVNLRDKPIVRLGGSVWNDVVHNDKVGQGLDGKMGNDPATGTPESKVAGVHVYLFTSDGTPVTTDIYGTPYNVVTDSSGNYKFDNLDATKSYYVQFVYDGVNYQAELNTAESKTITEINREAFNKNFTTISGTGYYEDNGSSNANAGQLNYTTVPENSGTKGTAKLNTLIRGGNPAYPVVEGNVLKMGDSVNTIYQMRAQTGNYSFDPTSTSSANSWMNTWTGTVGDKTTNGLNLTMGLANRNADLAVTKDVSSATVSINGKATTYNYNDLVNPDGTLTLKAKPEATGDVQAKYNLNIYSSDYNFRLDAYKQTIANNVNTAITSAQAMGASAEIKVDVTYAIVINNQSYTVLGPDGKTNLYDNTVQVDSVLDYFDASYKYVDGSAKYKQSNGSEYAAPAVTVGGQVTIGGVKYNLLNITGLGQKLGDGGQQVVYLTFEVKPDSDMWKNLQQTPYTEHNYAEVQKYTTAAGLVDKDSAAGNALKKDGSVPQVEDDTDSAPGLTVQVPKEQTRAITGTVWDDTSAARQSGAAGTWNPGDGIINNNETPVDDVIVQLVEIKNLGGANYEYVWQETTSGPTNGIVGAVSMDGTKVDTYAKPSGLTKGQYKFTGYIPGNYIIRYIYGDGTVQYYDTKGNKIAVPDNVKKYNGQDYQSTIDNKANPYNAAFNYAGTGVADNKARDNESRRLQVMSKSVLIDQTTGLALRDATNLADTWMCAETGAIDIPVEYNATVVDGTALDLTKNPNAINNMNFGLQLRPQEKLTLEKHVTALTLVPAGSNTPILDTDNNIKTNLITMMSDRANRGEWYVGSDSELKNGLTLQATYTYTVKNEGEIDYLSKALVDAYTGKSTTDYAKVLSDSSVSTKALIAYDPGNTYSIGQYLGSAYYTGNKTAADAAVPARAEVLDEAVNNDLSFTDDAQSDFKKVNPAPEGRTVYNSDGVAQTAQINTIVETKAPTKPLVPGNAETRKIFLTRVTSANDRLTYPSYIAQVKLLSDAAGRRDVSVPGNLQYVHSDDARMTMENSNQPDESWAETITLGPPTGGIVDKQQLPVYIAIIGTSALIVIGGSILAIKTLMLGRKK